MDNFTHVTVDKLRVECVQNIVPKGFKNLHMSDAVAGAQPVDTYILGSVLEFHKKVEVKNGFRKRIIIQEVLADGADGVKVCASFYKNIADDLERLLKSSKTSQGQWLIICNASLSAYMGPDPKEYHSLFLQVCFGNTDSKVWLLTERSGSVVPCRNDEQVAGTSFPTASRKNSGFKKSYTTLENCKLGMKYNVMAVVTEIVKNPSITSNGNLHMLVGIADPSSSYEDGLIKDLLLQIFCKCTGEANDFLSSIEHGHVIRIRDMMMELYKHEVRAKIFSERQLVYFPGGAGDDVIPNTTVTTFELSGEDIDLVKSLRTWSAEHRKEFQVKKKAPDDRVDLTTPSLPSTHKFLEINAKIKEIDKPMTFQLWCEIFRMRSIHSPAENMHILQVRDGTKTNLLFKRYDFEDTTQELNSESETYCQPGSETVDVFVKGKVILPSDLEPGDVVCLKGISCHRVDRSPSESLSFFELVMEDGSTIMKPSKTHSEIKKVKEMIRKGHEQQLTESSQDTFCEELALTLKSVEVHEVQRSPKPLSARSPNRINTHPVSVPNARSNTQPTRQVVQSLTPRLGSPNIHSQFPCSKPGSPRFASPKLPSQTDSLEIAVRNISDMSGKRQREECDSPLRKGSSSFLQSNDGPQNVRRRLLSGNSIEDLDVSRIEFPSDVPSSTQVDPPQVQGEENRFRHPSVPDINVGPTPQRVHSSTPAFKNVSRLPEKTNEAAFENISQEESPSIELMGDNSELDLEDLSSSLPEVNNLGVEDSQVVDSSSSTEIHSETVIQCTDPTSNTEVSGTGDSDEVSNTSKRGNSFEGSSLEFICSKPKEPNSLKRKMERSVQNGEDTSTNCSSQDEPLPSSSESIEEPNSVKRKRQTPAVSEVGTSTNCVINNKALLTTECRKDVIYITIRALLSEGKKGVLYLVPGIVKRIFMASNHHCNKKECLEGGMCYHNWVWGLCDDCGKSFDSEELRKKYTKQELANSRLSCTECCQERRLSARKIAKRNKVDSLLGPAPSKIRLRSTAAESKASKKSKSPQTTKSGSKDSKKMNANAKSINMSNLKVNTSREDSHNAGKIIIPFIRLLLLLQDPGDGSEMFLDLSGDHAKQFFGVEPTFRWLTEKADDTVVKLVRLLMQQKTPLWFGVSKSVNPVNTDRYLLAHTSLIMVLRNQGQ